MMSQEQIVGDLIDIGFSEHEARLYLALHALGAGTAYEVAKAASLPVPNTYNVIRALTARNAVRAISQRPARYVAVAPEELFAQLASTISEKCSSIVESLKKVEPASEVSFVDIILDKPAIVSRVRTIIEAARTQIIVKGPHDLPGDIIEAIRGAALRGVQCLFVHYGDAPEALTSAGVLCWPHEGNGIRLGMGADYLTICCDFENALIYRMDPDTEAAYSENRSFVYMTSVMIRHEIYLAEIMSTFGSQIEERFGPGLYDLRKTFSMSPLGDAFEQYVRTRLDSSA